MIATNTNSVLSVLPNVKSMDNFAFNDKVIQQLLNKLDKGTETIMNLRSLLTFKTAELNELVRQLELIDQVLMNVEDGTEQIELVLKDVINAGQDKLLHAEATLDSAIKSACSLYSIDSNEQQRMIIVNKINNLLNELNINSTLFWKNDQHNDLKVLQDILVNLHLAKTIATTIKNDAKLRSTMLKNNNNKNAASFDQIKKMGDKLRNQIELYKSYTRNNTFHLNDKEDLLDILDREDKILSKKIAMISTRQQITTTTSSNVTIATKKKRQSTLVTMTTVNNSKNSNINMNKPLPPTPSSPPQQHTNNNNNNNNYINKQTMSFLLLSRHTSSSKAKSKEPKRNQQQQPQGPGSTLRLRNMLAKRNPALKILNEQKKSGTTIVC